MPEISIIIPVKTGATTLDRCLKGLRNQTVGASLEIIILDSMSEDESRDIALAYGATIIDVPVHTFNHGLTRNAGIQKASGELIFLTVQDAWTDDVTLLERMAAHFNNSEIMGVCGHQAIPHEEDKNPLLWYHPYSKPQVQLRQVTDVNAFNRLPKVQQEELIAWDDVVAMYRRNALLEQPFVETDFAEDWVWSHQALLRGWKLIYDSSAVVYHYHHQSYQYTYKLTYTLNYHSYKFFHFVPSFPSIVKPLIKATYHLLKKNSISLKKRMQWIGYNIIERMAILFSTIDFLVRLKVTGVKGIESGYKKYCKTIPQGRQNQIEATTKN